MYMHMHMYMHTYMYMYTYVYMHTYMYMYTYMYIQDIKMIRELVHQQLISNTSATHEQHIINTWAVKTDTNSQTSVP